MDYYTDQVARANRNLAIGVSSVVALMLVLIMVALVAGL